MALRLASAEVNAVWALVQIQLAAPDAHPMRGAAQIAGYSAAKVPDAAAPTVLRLSVKLNARVLLICRHSSIGRAPPI